MSNPILVEKDPDNQRPIPLEWRETLSKIVDALREHDFHLARGIPGVPSLSEGRATAIKESIEDYGARLTALPEDTWGTSACQWMDSYWELLVDLFTESEGASDLVLSARVRESSLGYFFDVLSVHVP